MLAAERTLPLARVAMVIGSSLRPRDQFRERRFVAPMNVVLARRDCATGEPRGVCVDLATFRRAAKR
jgi:hypothetical protein